MKKLLKFLVHHKIFTGIIIVLIAGTGYHFFKSNSGTDGVRYVLATATKGTLITSVSGNGQISASDQMDIKTKSPGDVVYVSAQAGQAVKDGQLLLQIDATDAAKAVRNAEISLETAKLDFEQAKKNDAASLVQSEDDLKKAAEDGFNAVVGYFYDLPSIMTDMESILYGKDINKNQDNLDAYADILKANYEMEILKYRNSAAESYSIARESYDKNFKNYKETSRYAESETIVESIDETHNTAKKISEAIRNADNFISFVKDKLTLGEFDMPRILSAHQSIIKADTNKANGILSGLLSAKRTIENSRKTIEKINSGDNSLALRAKSISIQQKEDALTSARQALADCYVRAPFNGILAKVNVKKGDSVSNGTALATIITKQQVAEISLNEIDVSKIKVGQKANLTFDAVSDFTMTGLISEVDSLGAVSQGVVTYGVKIIIDTQDDRIKPGMSVSAAIIIDIKQDALLIPNSALKNMDDKYYVEILENPPAETNATGVAPSAPPKQILVEVGSSNDEYVEITNGLKDGDTILSRTIQLNAPNQTQQQPTSIFRMQSTGGGGAARSGEFR